MGLGSNAENLARNTLSDMGNNAEYGCTVSIINQVTAEMVNGSLPKRKIVINAANNSSSQKSTSNSIISTVEAAKQQQKVAVEDNLIAGNVQLDGNNVVNNNSVTIAEKNAIATTVSSENFEKPVTNTYTASYNNTNKPIAQSAVYKELETDDEQKTLYVGFVAINKDKLRGVTRKLGSLFGKKAKKDPEDLKDVMVYN
ncbi:MAG: hypothetical protein ACOVNR_05940 [Chitinophagaceae bacterium]